MNGVPAVMDTRVKCVKLTPESFELQFAKTTADDNGNWAVIAKNAHGEMSQFFSFAALMMPKFEEKLKDMEANEGKQVSSISGILKRLQKCDENRNLPIALKSTK